MADLGLAGEFSIPATISTTSFSLHSQNILYSDSIALGGNTYPGVPTSKYSLAGTLKPVTIVAPEIPTAGQIWPRGASHIVNTAAP